MRDLQCPICFSPLNNIRNCEECREEFEQVDGSPVLVDFNESILKRLDYIQAKGWGTHRLGRGSRIGRALQRITYGNPADNPTKGNVAAFLREIPGKRVLVIGGGTVGQGMDQLYTESEVIGTDIYHSPNIALICDGHKLPFADRSFDGVVIQAVLEHVLNPDQVVAEIYRVLRSSGVVYAETPFMQQVHEGAYDFTRFTFSGHRWLFRWFDQVDAGSIFRPGIPVLWSLDYFYKSVGLGAKLSALLTAPFFWLRLLGDRSSGPSLDSASGVYFLGRKSETPLQASDMPGYYLASR